MRVDRPDGSRALEGRYPVEAGTVRLDLRPGPYRLWLAAAGTAVHRVPLDAPGRVGPIVLQPPATLEVSAAGRAVRLRDVATGRVHGRWSVHGAGSEVFPLIDGRAVIDDLPPGTWRVEVLGRADGRVPAATVSLAPGGAATVELAGEAAPPELAGDAPAATGAP